MKNKFLERKIRIKAQPGELNKLEAFIEKICDDFHVYDTYYGNIVASNTFAFEMCIERAPDKPFYFDICFTKKPTGMFFALKIHDYFLDFAKQYEIVKGLNVDDTEAFGGELEKMMMLRLLSDEIILNAEEESLTMVFHITGVNEMLTNQRIELLQQYYAKLQIEVKQ